jgi:hypothetical protein
MDVMITLTGSQSPEDKTIPWADNAGTQPLLENAKND